MPSPPASASGVCNQKTALCLRVSFMKKARASSSKPNHLHLRKRVKQKHTHPIAGSNAPAISAPNATPTVKQVLRPPMNKPRRLTLVMLIKTLIATGKLPAAPVMSNTRLTPMTQTEPVSGCLLRYVPMPVNTLPTKNILSDGATDVTTSPTAKTTLETSIYDCGRKI